MLKIKLSSNNSYDLVEYNLHISYNMSLKNINLRKILKIIKIYIHFIQNQLRKYIYIFKKKF